MRPLSSSRFLSPHSRPCALPAAPATGRAGIFLNGLDEYGRSRARDYFAAPAELPERPEGLDL